jgi:hypothetical protein
LTLNNDVVIDRQATENVLASKNPLDNLRASAHIAAYGLSDNVMAKSRKAQARS